MNDRAENRAGSTPIASKVLNNNVVIVIDGQGRERVLMGRGLGFQMRPDSPVDEAKVEKTFILEGGTDADHARQLLQDVPYAVVEAVTAAVVDAERSLGRDLGRRFPLAVIDHVHYLVERIEQGLRIPSTALPELRVLHPDEFAVATRMAESIGRDLGTEFPPEEAAFLTMHVLNATRDELNGTAALLFRRVQHVVSTVETGLGVQLDQSSIDYSRFILHVKFLLQRLVNRSMLQGGDSSFFEFAKNSYPQSFTIAERVKAYVKEATGSELTDEETLFVIVHVERLRQHVSPPGGTEVL